MPAMICRRNTNIVVILITIAAVVAVRGIVVVMAIILMITIAQSQSYSNCYSHTSKPVVSVISKSMKYINQQETALIHTVAAAGANCKNGVQTH